MPGIKGRSGGPRQGAGPKFKGAIEWQVSGVYTDEHYKEFPPERFGSGTYLLFKNEEDARRQVQEWLGDPKFNHICLFKQRTRPGTDLIQQLSREDFTPEHTWRRLGYVSNPDIH